ncbi:hypothetical protein V500_06841 [Pseudogymnoascus sp. VKM F-4518 (FW-2643)]|nr:hypothetical protein V500_06841 [Pseudogymnoascus sp. VKM F-4518 (FW-2643)]
MLRKGIRVTTDLSPRLAGAPAVVLAAISGTVAVGSAACIFGQVVGCAAAAIALGVQSVVATFFYLYKVFQKKMIHHCFLREALGQAHSTSTLNTSQLQHATFGASLMLQLDLASGLRLGTSPQMVPSITYTTAAQEPTIGKITATNTIWDQVDDDVPVANSIASFIVSSDSALICADLEDSDVAINAGVMGTDNDNQEDVYTGTYLQQALDFCAAGDGLKKLLGVCDEHRFPATPGLAGLVSPKSGLYSFLPFIEIEVYYASLLFEWY